ncbi:MAG: PEP-CTERM sorting domain-containing protein [Phycisphaerae bacterium]
MFASLTRGFVAFGAITSAATAIAGHTTTFDNGTEGWSVSGRETILPNTGNPGAAMDVELIDVFGAEIRNDTNPLFIGDFTARGRFKLTVDVRIDSITFFGTEVSRDLIAEFRDYTPRDPQSPYCSVWYHLSEISASQPGWRRYSVEIADPTSETLPPGWGGSGAEDPETFEPILPEGRTFASVLANTDELRFTTFVPGWFFGFTNFFMAVDNVGWESIGGDPCVGDVDGNGEVTLTDLAILLTNYGLGEGASSGQGDTDGDGDVDLSDLAALLGNFGVIC